MPGRLYVFLLSLGLVGALFLIEHHAGLDLSDEGFLWYGAQRIARGEVPVRDFESYDPARYYWTAAWFWLLGRDGPIALRAACAGFQFLGLVAGLAALRRQVRSRSLLALAGVVIALWIWPSFRSFDCAVSLATLLLTLWLLERPSLRRQFTAGIGVGLAAFFGKNHGLYAGVASVVATLLIASAGERARLPSRLAAWSAGLLVGYSPMLLMMALVPGFFPAFAESVSFLVRRGATTMPKPIPWPWAVTYHGLGWTAVLSRFSVGTLYVALPLFYAGLTWLVARGYRRPVLVASLAVGLPYLHSACVRAEMYHLASGIHPFLVGAFALVSLAHDAGRRVLAAGLVLFLAASSALAVGVRHQRQIEGALGLVRVIPRTVRGDTLRLFPEEARVLSAVERIHDEMMAPGDEIFVAPIWQTLYPALGMRSPVHRMINYWPLTTPEQQRMIAEIEARSLRWALVCDFPMDNREEFRFSNSHALVWAHLEQRFEQVSVGGLPSDCQLRRRREADPAGP